LPDLRSGLCGLGNLVADFSNASNDAAAGLVKAGLVTTAAGAVVGIAGNPEVGVPIASVGLGLMETGGVLGIVSGGSQILAGLLQTAAGAPGGDNILKGTVNLLAGSLISKALSPAIPKGYRTVSQRAGDNGAKNTSSIGNGLWNAGTSYIPNLSATKKRC